jgi:hypothetical protein
MQMNLPGLAVPSQQPLRVIRDLGPVQQRSATSPHRALAENGSHYIIKAPALMTSVHPYLIANEMICASLADVLGLPILDWRLLDMQGTLVFGSAWMDKDSFYPSVTEDKFHLCQNSLMVYDLVVFDAWVCNRDRHTQNLLIRRNQIDGETDEVLTLLLNDHDRCPISPSDTPANLPRLLGLLPSRCIGIPFVRDSIRDGTHLSHSIDSVVAISSQTIEEIVNSIPEVCLPAHERPAMVAFFTNRQAELHQIFINDQASFTNLNNGTQPLQGPQGNP